MSALEVVAALPVAFVWGVQFVTSKYGGRRLSTAAVRYASVCSGWASGQPVCNLFDFFAGTSCGGMLVLGGGVLDCRSLSQSQPSAFVKRGSWSDSYRINSLGRCVYI